MGNVHSILKQKKNTNYYTTEFLNRLLKVISYMSVKIGSTDLQNNKRLKKALNQLKDAAYIIKTELKNDTKS